MRGLSGLAGPARGTAHSTRGEAMLVAQPHQNRQHLVDRRPLARERQVQALQRDIVSQPRVIQISAPEMGGVPFGDLLVVRQGVIDFTSRHGFIQAHPRYVGPIDLDDRRPDQTIDHPERIERQFGQDEVRPDLARKVERIDIVASRYPPKDASKIFPIPEGLQDSSVGVVGQFDLDPDEPSERAFRLDLA